MRPSRIALWRAARLAPDGAARGLHDALIAPALVEPLGAAEVAARFTRYLLDPRARAMVVDDVATAAWVAASPLVRLWGPGGAVPVDDELAAIVAGAGRALTDDVLAARFAPRADALIAAIVAGLPDADGAAALTALRAPGPDEPITALARLQVGRALAWSPHLHDRSVAGELVDELLAVLVAPGPLPRREAVARTLGAIARADTDAGGRSRAGLEAALAAAQAILADGDPDQPDASAWAQAHLAIAALGAAAPLELDAYLARHRALEAAWGGSLPTAYFDGLIVGGNPAPVATLVEAMLRDDGEARAAALAMAAQLPLDDAGPALIAIAGDADPAVRAAAIPTLGAIGAVDPLMTALDDDAPEVAAAAALALVELGERDRVRTRRPDDPELVRRAAIAAATGATDTQTLGELAVALVDRLLADEPLDGSPLVAALGAALLSSTRGLARAAALVDGIPAVAPLLALALPRGPEPVAAMVAPPEPLSALDRALVAATEDDPAGRLLGLAIVARLAGDDPVHTARLAAELADPEAAAPILFTLAARRGRAPEAAAIAPHLAVDAPVRALALAAAGRALPVDDPAWAQIAAAVDDPDPELAAAAWIALVDRARAP